MQRSGYNTKLTSERDAKGVSDPDSGFDGHGNLDDIFMNRATAIEAQDQKAISDMPQIEDMITDDEKVWQCMSDIVNNPGKYAIARPYTLDNLIAAYNDIATKNMKSPVLFRCEMSEDSKKNRHTAYIRRGKNTYDALIMASNAGLSGIKDNYFALHVRGNDQMGYDAIKYGIDMHTHDQYSASIDTDQIDFDWDDYSFDFWLRFGVGGICTLFIGGIVAVTAGWGWALGTVLPAYGAVLVVPILKDYIPAFSDAWSESKDKRYDKIYNARSYKMLKDSNLIYDGSEYPKIINDMAEFVAKNPSS